MTDVARLRRRLRRALLIPIVAGTFVACGKSGQNDTGPEHFPACPGGKWCGTAAQANSVLPPENMAPAGKEMGCPTELYPQERDAGPALPADIPRYASMSLNREDTKAKGAGHCCYDWMEPCPGGRPLLVDDRVVTAAPPRDIAGVGLGAALAELWLDDALMEHASVASFARAALELMALAAPSELIADCHQAALDEIAHARACFALAEQHGWQRVEPGPLECPPSRPTDLARMAADVFVEGCVGETVAALCAERALSQCQDEQTRAALKMIARDEAAHAALAFRTLRWLLDRGGRRVFDALMAKASELRAHSLAVVPQERAGLSHADRGELGRWGRLDADQRQRARIDAWEGVIDPLLTELAGAVLAGAVLAGAVA
jgi:hypothetical protein